MKNIWPLEEKKCQLLKHLRQELNLSRDLIVNEDLLKTVKGTFLHARIELGMELFEFFQTLKSSIRKE